MNDLDKAKKELNAGGVVGIPTETVYGLAARIDSSEGINKIFSTKERPFFDPLIVHFASIDQIKAVVTNWSEVCDKLANEFWPGPMTLILNKKDTISSKITSGLDTVGCRIPNSQLTIDLISMINCPLAAPSANKFKKISPTSAQHVRDEFPNIQVLDGGQCEVGIESTILEVLEDQINILRPGMITKERLEKVLGDAINISYKESPIAPGHLKEHYRPNLPVLLKVEGENLASEFKNSNTWKVPNDPILAARLLYSELREKDSKEFDSIEVVLQKDMLEKPLFRGILNRLIKASYLKSPLIKPEY